MILTVSLSDPEDAGLILRTMSDLTAAFFAVELRGGAFGGRPLGTGLELSTSIELGPPLPSFFPDGPGSSAAPLVELDSDIADPWIVEACCETKCLL